MVFCYPIISYNTVPKPGLVAKTKKAIALNIDTIFLIACLVPRFYIDLPRRRIGFLSQRPARTIRQCKESLRCDLS